LEWTDQAIVLSTRRHGETSAIVSLLTRERGRHAGLLRGAGSKRLRGVVMPGNEVRASWRARIADHLGTVHVEPAMSRAGFIMDDAARLAALSSACALLDQGLMEREAHPALYNATAVLFDAFWWAKGAARSRIIPGRISPTPRSSPATSWSGMSSAMKARGCRLSEDDLWRSCCVRPQHLVI
jgi:hypothetical protein